MVREYSGLMAHFVNALAVVMSLYHLIFISGLASKLGLHLFLLPYRAGSLALVLFMAFLLYPARKGETKGRLGWTDILFILAGVSPCIFLLFYAGELIEMDTQFAYRPALIAFIPLLIAILEAVRRMTGISVVIVGIFFFMYPLFQGYVPGLLGGRSFDVAPMASYLLVNLNLGILGVAYGAASSIIIIYVLFSRFLLTSGASDFFLNLALSIMGGLRGGPAKVSIIASSFFGTVSGSVTANVAATGSITIPMMKKVGYRSHFAGAVESVSSNGGQIVPPVMGLVVFVMADVTGIPYWQLVLASIFPALLYYVGLFVQVDMEAARTGLQGLSRDQIPSFRETMKKGWFYLVPLVGLIILLIVLKYSPEESGLYAILILFIVTLFSKEKRLGPKKIAYALATGAKSFVMPAAVCSLVGIIIGSVMQTGLGIKLSSFLIQISGGSVLVLLLLTAVVCYMLGGEMGSIPLYIMMVTLTAPALLKSGIDTLPSHLFVLWYGLTSFITPPVCIAVYVSCAISGSGIWKSAFAAMRLGIATYIVPFMFIYRPPLLLVGSAREIAVAITISILGISAMALGISNYFLRRLKIVERLLYLVGGALLIIPLIRLNLIGLAVIAGVTIAHFLKRHDTKQGV
jgi:TRAP transporter 4TM/12TM fusion protein